MRITNELVLPEPLRIAVQADDYSKGECDFSTTELISPPRIAVLKRQWQEHLSEDVSDRIFALLGKSIHSILQHSAAGKRYLVEKRFIAEHDGYRIGGQIDLFDIKTSTLQDWKITSRHSTNEAKLKYPWSTLRMAPEGKGWVEQANINAYLMLRNGWRVDAIQYVAIYRDWSKMEAQRKNDYPSRQVEVLTIPKWPLGVAEAYLSERIKLHLEARKNLPMCSSEERWEKPPTWAVTKKGNKRAYRLMPTETEANELAASLSMDGRTKTIYEVQPRDGENTRCLYYCPVSGFCSFGREQLQHKQEQAA